MGSLPHSLAEWPAPGQLSARAEQVPSSPAGQADMPDYSFLTPQVPLQNTAQASEPKKPASLASSGLSPALCFWRFFFIPDCWPTLDSSAGLCHHRPWLPRNTWVCSTQVPSLGWGQWPRLDCVTHCFEGKGFPLLLHRMNNSNHVTTILLYIVYRIVFSTNSHK